ncbi:MAG: I78 family peptidase inhibitor [Pseudomonadota bacterium]
MRAVLMSAACLALAACVVVPLPTGGGGVTPAPEDACGASGLQGLVGQPSAVLQTMRFAGPLRIIEPDMAVTMDYSAARLNIWLNSAGRIDRVTCG